jgi:hypothetical protein
MKRGKIYDWLPLWRNKWLMGSTRWELDSAERGVFIDFLCLAGADDGFIRANPTTPYPVEYLAGMLQVPVDLVLRTIEKCVAVGKLTRFEDGVLFITSWEAYTLNPRSKRKLMDGASSGPPSSNNLDSKYPREEIPTLRDSTERSALNPADLGLVPGPNENSALDKALAEARTKDARLAADLKRKKERGEG